MKPWWGSGVMKMSGSTRGCVGQRAGCLPLFFWILPDCAWVKVVCGGRGDGSVSRWWLLVEFSGFGGSGLVWVMGVGTRVWLSSGRGGQGVWLT